MQHHRFAQYLQFVPLRSPRISLRQLLPTLGSLTLRFKHSSYNALP